MKWTTGLFEKLRNGFIAFVSQRATPIPRGDFSPFAKPASALRSLPSVALSSGAVKAFLLYHKLYFFERIVYLNLRLGDDLIIPGNMLPLTLANIGEENVIKKIGGNPAMKKHLENLGFVAGGNVKVINTISGNVIVSVKESRIAISREMAQKIMI